MVYSMPAQPPFLTPILRPMTSGPFDAMTALTRAAAASVSVNTLGRGRRVLRGVFSLMLCRSWFKAMGANRNIAIDLRSCEARRGRGPREGRFGPEIPQSRA